MSEIPLTAADHDARLLALGMGFCVLLLALAFLGELWLGYLGRKRMAEALELALEREHMLAMKLVSSRAEPAPRQSVPSLRAEAGAPAGAGKPLPEMPVGHELSDDDVWRDLNREWAREALEAKQAEQERADILTARLREVQARRAEALAKNGTLEGDREQEKQSAS